MPIRPLIIPERKVDFLITYDASLDAEYSWVNATNLIGKTHFCQPLHYPPAIKKLTLCVLNDRLRPICISGWHAIPENPVLAHHGEPQHHQFPHLLRLQLHLRPTNSVPSQRTMDDVLQLQLHTISIHR